MYNYLEIEIDENKGKLHTQPPVVPNCFNVLYLHTS